MARLQRSSPTPDPDETTVPASSVAEPIAQIRPVRLRRGERAITTIETPERPPTYDFVGGSFRQMSALVGQLAVEHDLSKRACHLILVLAGKMDRGGLIHMTQGEMAEAMASERQPDGWDRTDVNKLLKQLRRIGLIYPEPRKRGIYRFNPRVVFYGSAAEQEEAIAQIPATVPEIRLSSEEQG